VNLPPGESAEVPVPVKPVAHPQPGAAYWLRVSFHLRRDAPWAKAGHEVAWQQMRYPVQTPPVEPLEPAGLPPLKVTEEGDRIRIEGRDFSATFSRAAGTLVSLVYGETEMLAHDWDPAGPVLQAWRAVTSNDKAFGSGRARDWRRAGLNRLARQVRSVTLDGRDARCVRVSVLAVSTTPTGAGFNHHATWVVRGDGSVDLDSRFEPFGDLPPLPRIGLVMHVAAGLERLRWYGRGPHENYCDRNRSADMGIWTGTVDEQYVPYPRPQETGTKTDVRWLTLTGPDGTGLLVVAEPAIAASACPSTPGTAAWATGVAAPGCCPATRSRPCRTACS
jgi:beta-galactosidase